MISVGITGGIGSGKSYVARVFEHLGIPLYYSDIEAKKIIRTSEVVRSKLVGRFGTDIYAGDVLNKPLLAQIIFNDKSALTFVNSVVHPAVREHFDNWRKENSAEPIVMKESALIFESGEAHRLDKVITVHADIELRTRRVMERDKVSRENVEQRMKNQLSDEEKILDADYLVCTDEGKMVLPQVLKIYKSLLQLQF